MAEFHAQLLGNPQMSLVIAARALAALEAAGAWDPTPVELMSYGGSNVTFFFQYTRAGAGGDMQFRIEISPYIQDADAPAGIAAWYRSTVFQAGFVVSGADSLSNIQRTDNEYGSTAAGAETFVYGPLSLEQTTERIRVVCAESGAVGTPGTVAVIAHFSPN